MEKQASREDAEVHAHPDSAAYTHSPLVSLELLKMISLIKKEVYPQRSGAPQNQEDVDILEESELKEAYCGKTET